METLSSAITALQFRLSMTGGRKSSSISDFWKHCKTLDEWKDHPSLVSTDDLGSIFAIIYFCLLWPFHSTGCFFFVAISTCATRWDMIFIASLVLVSNQDWFLLLYMLMAPNFMRIRSSLCGVFLQFSLMGIAGIPSSLYALCLTNG